MAITGVILSTLLLEAVLDKAPPATPERENLQLSSSRLPQVAEINHPRPMDVAGDDLL